MLHVHGKMGHTETVYLLDSYCHVRHCLRLSDGPRTGPDPIACICGQLLGPVCMYIFVGLTGYGSPEKDAQRVTFICIYGQVTEVRKRMRDTFTHPQVTDSGKG